MTLSLKLRNHTLRDVRAYTNRPRNMGLAADRCGALRLRPVQTRQSVTVDLPIETSGLECQMFEPKLGAVFMPLGDAAWDVNHRKHVSV